MKPFKYKCNEDGCDYVTNRLDHLDKHMLIHKGKIVEVNNTLTNPLISLESSSDIPEDIKLFKNSDNESVFHAALIASSEENDEKALSYTNFNESNHSENLFSSPVKSEICH